MTDDIIENYLLRLLTHKVYTRKQLIEKLLKKGADPEKAEELLDKYAAYGYVDDMKYAKLYIDSHQEWGKIRLTAELCHRGIDSLVVMEALEVMEPDELTRADLLVRQWLDCDISKEKILGRLARRGFSFSICREAWDRACEHWN